MINNQKILGLLGISAKAGKIVSGTDACIQAIEKRKIKLIIVSDEASDKTKKNFEYICNKYNTKMKIFETIENLSKAIGKKNRAVLGIKDINLSNEIEKIINGGEVIG